MCRIQKKMIIYWNALFLSLLLYFYLIYLLQRNHQQQEEIFTEPPEGQIQKKQGISFSFRAIKLHTS